MLRCCKIACSFLMFSLCCFGKNSAVQSAVADAPVIVGGEKSLDKVVQPINKELEAKYALFEPTPITVERFREAVEAKIEILAKSKGSDAAVVKALQRIVTEKRLPDGFSFYLASTSAKFKKDSLEDGVLEKKVINLSYNLSVPVAVAGETTQTVRLRSLAEQFFILKKEIELYE